MPHMIQFWRSNIDPTTEPLRVLIKRGEWIDSARGDRPVKYKVDYPDVTPDTSLPVVIWSHGLVVPKSHKWQL